LLLCLRTPPTSTLSTLSLHDALPISSLRSVLEMAGPLASAVEVVCVGADAGTSADAGARIAYERSLPIDDAMREDVLVAYAMNGDRKSTRLNSSHEWISYAVFCLKKK